MLNMAKTKFGDKDVKSIKMLEMEEIRVTADLGIWVLLILIPLIWLMMVMMVMDRDHQHKHYIDNKDCGDFNLDICDMQRQTDKKCNLDKCWQFNILVAIQRRQDEDFHAMCVCKR